MFSLMGNCWSSRKSGPRRRLTLSVLGLDNAGKTVTANILQGETLQTAPTIGFQKNDLTLGRYDLTLFDLGGGKKIRAIWKKYLAEVYGIVYVVDASDSSRIEEATMVFKELLEDPKVSHKPVLVLANKQDVEGALDELDICDQMRLEEIVNANKCPCRVEMCSAVKGTGKKKDSRIKDGLQWLCDMIDLDFARLDGRVQEDLRVQEAERRKELEERRARVQKIREEREREEEAERKRLGVPEPESPTEDTIDGDPFKRLNYEELKQKETRLKAEKKKKGLDKNDNKASQPEVKQLPNGLAAALSDDDDDIIIASPSPRHSKLPPLHYQKPQLYDGPTQDKKNSHRKKSKQLETPVESFQSYSDRKPLADNPQFSGMENGYLGLSYDSHSPSYDGHSPRSAGRQLPALGEEKVEKKKKKRVKRNKLVPLDGQVEIVKPSSRSAEGSRALPWENPRLVEEPTRQTSSNPQLDYQLNHSSHNWGLVEDLPEPVTDLEYTRRKPNFDSDDIVT